MSRKLTFISLVCLLLLGLAAATAEARDVGGFAIGPTASLTSVTPNHGAPGDTVTLTGSNFEAFSTSPSAGQVLFGLQPAQGDFSGTAATKISWSDTVIVCKVPDVKTGALSICVELVALRVWPNPPLITYSNTLPFTVDAPPPPTITHLYGDHGMVHEGVSVNGSGFGATQGSSIVKFGDTAATVSGWTDEWIDCQVPVMATGDTHVTVIVGGRTSNAVSFHVDQTPPGISWLDPTNGPPATSVTIHGHDFGDSQGSSSVKFGTAMATVDSWSATSITCKVPTMTPVATIVTVTVGTLTSNGELFTVDAPLGPPAITTVTPNHGPPGTSVIVAGSNFGATQWSGSVLFGTTWAAVDNWGTTSITCKVPNTAAGKTTVRVNTGNQSSNAVDFLVEAGAVVPQITGLTPDHGLPAASVIVAGSGFGVAQGASSVKFGATAAAVVSWSATSIACTVPALASGPTTVAVTVGTLTSNGVAFTVDGSVVGPKVTLKLSGRRVGALKLGRSVTAKCAVTPSSLAGESCRLIVQKKMKGYGWIKVTSKAWTIGPSGTYSWKYKPPARGSYRMQATINATAQHSAAKSPRRAFKVK